MQRRQIIVVVDHTSQSVPRADCWRVRPAMVDDNLDDSRGAQYCPYSLDVVRSRLVTVPARDWQCGGQGFEYLSSTNSVHGLRLKRSYGFSVRTRNSV